MINNSVIKVKITPQNSRTNFVQDHVFGIIITERQLSCLIGFVRIYKFHLYFEDTQKIFGCS